MRQYWGPQYVQAAQRRSREIITALPVVRDGSAKPQIIRETCTKVWPEKWGMTVTQFASLLEKCQQDSDWDDDYTISDLVRRYVIPMTRGTGMGYALLVNVDRPKDITVMISHAWAENALEFCRSLERSVEPEESLFICAFSLYQCEDHYGPTIAEQLGSLPQESPFFHVLQTIHDRGLAVERRGGLWRNRVFLVRLPWALMLLALSCIFTPVVVRGCIPMHSVCAFGTCTPILEYLPIYTWSWEFKALEGQMLLLVRVGHVLAILTIFSWMAKLVLLQSGHLFKGRMVAVPNHNCEMYTRLWCVFEMFVAQTLQVPVKLANTLASAGVADSAHAQCSNAADAAKINAEIQAFTGFEEEEGLEVLGKRVAQFRDQLNMGLEAHEEVKDAGYAMLDAAIRHVSNKAWSRALLIEILQAFPLALCLMCTVRLIKKGSKHWWEEQASHKGDEHWYHHVMYLASHGRLGYDLFCGQVFEASPQAWWTWFLIFGVLLGYAVVIGSAVYYAKKAQGRITYLGLGMLAGGFLFGEAILFIAITCSKEFFHLCEVEPYRLNWFLIGFSAAIAQGSLIIVLLLIVAGLRGCLVGRPKAFGRYAERYVKAGLLFVGLSVFLVLMVATSRVHRPEHYFPSFVINFALIFGWLIGPLAIAWTNAVRFGVMLSQPPNSIPGCPYNYVSDSSHSSGSDES
ncbi:unnamed protein product [Effrenium voratum]|nr:unnamed protein product [Effrenium voratum]